MCPPEVWNRSRRKETDPDRDGSAVAGQSSRHSPQDFLGDVDVQEADAGDIDLLGQECGQNILIDEIELAQGRAELLAHGSGNEPLLDQSQDRKLLKDTGSVSFADSVLRLPGGTETSR